MVDTTDIKEIVVTPETPLDPSPKRVEGHEIGETVSADLGSVAGTLHKPPLKIETEDKGQSTAEELVKSAEERPQLFKNVVLDNLKAKGLIQIKDKNALVDRFGNPVIKSNVGETVTIDEIDTELAAAGKVIGSDGHGNATWLDKVNLIETEDIVNVLDTVKVGDVVVVGNQVYIINYVDKSEYPYSVSMFVVDGENDVIRYCSFSKDAGEDWSQDLDVNYVDSDTFVSQKGTKLYKHDITMTDGQHDIMFYVISLSGTPLTITDLENGLHSNLSSDNIISISAENINDAWLFAPYYLTYDASENKVHAILCESPTAISTYQQFQSQPTLTDTVTPL